MIIADEEASDFLPPLPPLAPTTDPNDTRKTQQRMREASARVHDIMLGAKQDGVRPRPTIDLTLQTYEVQRKEKGLLRSIVVARVFGMKCNV